MRKRTTVLLGAGASYEANVPMAAGMTDAVDACLRRYRADYPNQLEALNFAITALREQLKIRGTDPAPLDIETLFSAIQMLAEIEDLEVVPFVEQWRQPVDRLSIRPRLYPDSEMLGNSAFCDLQDSTVRALRHVIIESQSSADYLKPLLNLTGRRPVNIVTLNYDTTVETLSRSYGVALTDGVEGWTGGLRWDWGSQRGGIRLLKLHGSVDWLFSSPTWPPGQPGDKARRLKIRRIVRDEERIDPWTQLGRTSPAVIFGRRGKLRSEGPYLAMLTEFSRILLEETNHLVIVGYSLRDEHVNEHIREWFNSQPNPRVTLIDPTLGKNPGIIVDQVLTYGFASALLTSMADDRRWSRGEYMPDASRHRILANGAGFALKEILS